MRSPPNLNTMRPLWRAAQLKLLEDYAALNGIFIASQHMDVETVRKSGGTAFGDMLRYLCDTKSNRRSDEEGKRSAFLGCRFVSAEGAWRTTGKPCHRRYAADKSSYLPPLRGSLSMARR